MIELTSSETLWFIEAIQSSIRNDISVIGSCYLSVSAPSMQVDYKQDSKENKMWALKVKEKQRMESIGKKLFKSKR